MLPMPRSLAPMLLACAIASGCATAKSGGTYVEEDLAEVPDLAGGGEDLRQGQAQDLRAEADLQKGQGQDLAPPPDLQSLCQPVPQSGCQAGQKCTTHDSVTTVCDPNGTQARGQSCVVSAAVDSCAAGNLCIDEGSGQCRAMCRTDTDCRDLKSYCYYALKGSGSIKVCTQPCDPVAISGCGAGLACVLLDLDTGLNQERTDCQHPGPSALGQRCDSSSDCQAGMACVSSACRRVCRRGNSAVCAVGQSCVDVLGGGLYLWPTYGVCN